MSRTKTMVELTPPDFALREEYMLTAPMTCGYCHGQGYFLSESTPYDDNNTTTCPVCKGSGRVEAEVSIKWKPSNNNKQ